MRKLVIKNPPIFIEECSDGWWKVISGTNRTLARVISEGDAKNVAFGFGKRFLQWPEGELERLRSRERQADRLEKEILCR